MKYGKLDRRAALQRGLWVVLPVRGLSTGKSRLAPALDRVERLRLNRKLLLHTLDVVGHWQGGLQRCIVMSACARVLVIARGSHAIALEEARPRAGLSSAVARAVTHAMRAGARSVLILPCDLPQLSTCALDALLDAAAAGAQIVLASDRAGTGTNALLLSVRQRFEFSYGPGSFARHVDAAAARGWITATCARAELKLDLDTPLDLAAWHDAGNALPPPGRMV